jgi:hypothetical protein
MLIILITSGFGTMTLTTVGGAGGATSEALSSLFLCHGLAAYGSGISALVPLRYIVYQCKKLAGWPMSDRSAARMVAVADVVRHGGVPGDLHHALPVRAYHLRPLRELLTEVGAAAREEGAVHAFKLSHSTSCHPLKGLEQTKSHLSHSMLTPR